MVAIVLTIRAARLLQALLTTSLGFAALIKPSLGLLSMGMALLWSAVLARKAWRTGNISKPLALVDALVALLVLSGLGAAITPRDLTSSSDWALPYAQSSALLVGSALGLRPWLGLAATAGLCATYLGTVRYMGDLGLSEIMIASGSCAGTVLHWAAGALGASFVRRQSRDVEAAGEEIRRREVAVAAAGARHEEFRRLHDDAIQVLERTSAAVESIPLANRDHARRAATRLRAASQPRPGDAEKLEIALLELVEEFGQLGLGVYIECSRWPENLDRATSTALVDAVHESLTNVEKHAGADRAAVRVLTTSNGAQISVIDQGKGFEPPIVPSGFGIAGSITRGVEKVGGRVEISSSPGRGTTVTMWVPAIRPVQTVSRLAGDRTETILVVFMLAARAAYCAYGAAVMLLNSSSYAAPALGAAALVLAVSTSVVLGAVIWRRRAIPLPVATLDSAVAVATLALVGGALTPLERGGSLNWALAYAVGASVWLALGTEWPARFLLSLALGLAYLLTTVAGPHVELVGLAAPVANAVSPPMFFVLAWVIVAIARRLATSSDEVQALEVRVGMEAAALREREQFFREVHVHAIQALDLVAEPGSSTTGDVRLGAARSVRYLRKAISGTPRSSLDTALSSRVAELLGQLVPPDCSVSVVDEELDQEPGSRACEALCSALREILIGTSRRRVSAIWVRLATLERGTEVGLRIKLPEGVTSPFWASPAQLLADAGGELDLQAGLPGELRVALRAWT